MILADFGINTKNIVAVVTDNAANMIRMSEDMNIDVQNDTNDEIDNDIEETERLELLVIQAIRRLPEIETIRCAQHVLQLVINDGILKENKPLLARIRKVVKAARRPLVKAYLNGKGSSQPLLDVVTRWGSTYLMIKSLNLIKDDVMELSENEPDLHMTRYQWTCAKELEDLMKAPYEVTLSLSSDSLTAGTFAYLWNRLKYQLEYGFDGMGTAMSEFMTEREAGLFSPLMLAAVSLDPKYSYILEEDQEEKARQAITKLVERLENKSVDEEDIVNDGVEALGDEVIIEQEIQEDIPEENGYDRMLRLRRASGNNEASQSVVQDEVRLYKK